MSLTIDTPLYNHIYDFPTVYEPSEDTFLLIDTLEQELTFIQSLNPRFVAEIGSGSGVNITALASVLKSSCFCVASDINNDACIATQKTSFMNGVQIECVNTDFLSCFRNQFDLILFNPPYVVTESNEIMGAGIERSWAGGFNGREVMDKLFPVIPQLLTTNGVFYLVVIKENGPANICRMFRGQNFSATIINEKKIRAEHLFVLKIQKLF